MVNRLVGGAGLLVAAAALHAAPTASYLLVDQQEIDAARAKAAQFSWAKSALDNIVQAADRALKKPLALPDRGGQWPHWYSCKRDGVRLQTVSPTEHRCPKCGEVYHGDPYDAVVLYGVHSGYSHDVENLGLAFRFTGRVEYARRAGEILAAYAGKYGSYRLHNINGEEKVGGGRVMAQTLDESVWLISMAWGYSLVRDTLDEPRRNHIEHDLLTAAADVIRAHRMGIHNIQCWKNSAVGLVGFVTGNQALVREAIDDPDRGFRVQIARGVTDDGLWYEGSLGYHQYMMSAIWPLMEAARHAGIDLYGDRVRTLFDAPLALALPNGDAPGFNDNNGANVTAYGPLYELAYARWHKPEYGRLIARTPRTSVQALLYGAEAPPSGEMIPQESVLLRAAGFAMLRAGGMTVAVRFGQHGGGHGHPDKLNIVTFAAGHLFGLDPGSINYGVPLHKEWYRSTIAHNTVSVDQEVQKGVDGRLEEWKSEGGETVLRASAVDAYPGVKMERTLRLNGPSLEDIFTCTSKDTHVYDWAFHAAGSFSSSLEFKKWDGSLYSHIEKVAEAKTDGDWWARWESDSLQYTVRVKAAPGTEVFRGEGPGKNPADRVPMIVVRRKGTSARFEAVHEAVTRPIPSGSKVGY
jgi:hypothetical protein